MMQVKKPYQDLTGKRFGRLVVLSLVGNEAGAKSPTKWVCRCDCGRILEVRAYNLKSGNTSSCGCLQKDIAADMQRKHGQTGTRLYYVWQHMVARCYRQSEQSYKSYGGRGITVCNEWKNDFQAFYDWAMSHGYSDDLTIDRIDVNGNYCPENCRWVTFKEQQRNKRCNVFVSFSGESKALCEWAEIFNCRQQDVYKEILVREGRVKKCGQID